MRPRLSSGQLLPLFALLLIALMGISALAVDVGYWRYQQRLLQSAADSAAVAGADELNYPALDDWSTAAKNEAAANGFTVAATVTVAVSHPPTTGPNTANANAVQVVVSEQQPALFGATIGFGAQWVSARAVAVLNATTRTCIYGLATSGYAVSINGATFDAPNCGISSNSGFEANGSTVTGSAIGYTTSLNSSGSSFPEAQPAVTIPQIDPCPSFAGCAYLTANPPTTGTCLTPTTFSGGSSVTLLPGRYCAALSINGVTAVTFSPGVYQLDGGMTLNGASTVTGAGVTFYNGSSGAAILIQGSSISLSAPTSGNTIGVMIYQPAANTSAFTMNGGGSGLAGMLYFPTASVQSNGELGNWLLVVANTFLINGSGVNVPTAAFPGYAGHSELTE
jgi:Flp pilus assembly protein TadG